MRLRSATMVISSGSVTYQFLDFELDVPRFVISSNGEALHVEPKILALIVFLIERRNRLVTREELMQGLWPDRVVSEASLTNIIKSARKLLNDDGRTQKCVKTVHGKGYRFVAEITEHPDVVENCRGDSDFPYIAVLPFQNMGPASDDDAFAEGISEDIITELSRFSDLRVIARHSSFQYNSAGADVEKIKRELLADYLVEGSVRRSADSLRITAQLIELETSTHIWAERFNVNVSELFAVEDEIISTIASVVCGELREVETKRAQIRKTEHLSSYDHLLRGLAYHKDREPTPENFHLAKAEFAKALELDQDNPRARAWILCAEASTWTAIDIDKIRTLIGKAQQVLKLDYNESEAHRILGSLHFTNKDYDEARFHFENALRLNPNDALSTIKYAHYLACMGESDRALSLASLAKRLNPRSPPWYDRIIAFIHYSKGDVETACEHLRRNPCSDPLSLALSAAFYHALGDTSKANKFASELSETAPILNANMLVAYDCYRDPDKVATLRDQMVSAGVGTG